MIPSVMDEVLSNWDESKRGRKPKLVTAVVTGQNPTGTTMSLERKQEFYNIAQKHDLVSLLFLAPVVARAHFFRLVLFVPY